LFSVRHYLYGPSSFAAFAVTSGRLISPSLRKADDDHSTITVAPISAEKHSEPD
jgi:hypothetical protein